MTEGIAYQNKDVEFKLLSETYKEKSFEAYGLNLPRIKEALPTNLPTVTANEKRMDKFMNEENAGIIRRSLDMTKVGRLLFEEGIEKGIEKGRHDTFQLIREISALLKTYPNLTSEEIAEKLQCDENEVDIIKANVSL